MVGNNDVAGLRPVVSISGSRLTALGLADAYTTVCHGYLSVRSNNPITLQHNVIANMHTDNPPYSIPPYSWSRARGSDHVGWRAAMVA